MTPLKAIRLKCLDCSAGSIREVTYCEMDDCPLYVYRKGHNPTLKGKRGKGNPEALRKYRLATAK